jgi:transcriptional regulator
MYIPKPFIITDHAIIDGFVKENAFATVITSNADGVPVATHLPLMLEVAPDGKRILHGHCARGNTHWKLMEQGRSTLVIFQGAHSYISPRWYNHENVPTWNYQTVHAYCQPNIYTDRERLRQAVSHLTAEYEDHSKYSVDGLSQRFLEMELRGIVGFILHVERFEAKFKLSQTRDAESHANIIAELERSESETERRIASAMKEYNPHDSPHSPHI